MVRGVNAEKDTAAVRVFDDVLMDPAKTGSLLGLTQPHESSHVARTGPSAESSPMSGRRHDYLKIKRMRRDMLKVSPLLRTKRQKRFLLQSNFIDDIEEPA
jgi:hypothetical protein